MHVFQGIAPPTHIMQTTGVFSVFCVPTNRKDDTRTHTIGRKVSFGIRVTYMGPYYFKAMHQPWVTEDLIWQTLRKGLAFMSE